MGHDGCRPGTAASAAERASPASRPGHRHDLRADTDSPRAVALGGDGSEVRTGSPRARYSRTGERRGRDVRGHGRHGLPAAGHAHRELPVSTRRTVAARARGAGTGRRTLVDRAARSGHRPPQVRGSVAVGANRRSGLSRDLQFRRADRASSRNPARGESRDRGGEGPAVMALIRRRKTGHVVCEALSVLCLAALLVPSSGTECLWDQYGVPHIFASDTPSLFRAFGYAQMHSHGELLLRLYGQARGRGAEYWDKRYLASDRWVRTNDIPRRATQWYAEQSPQFRANLDAFADGINAYAREHPNTISANATRVLPVSGADVLAHTQRVIQYTFVMSMPQAQAIIDARPRAAAAASNAWAIAGKRTTTGAPILL